MVGMNREAETTCRDPGATESAQNLGKELGCYSFQEPTVISLGGKVNLPFFILLNHSAERRKKSLSFLEPCRKEFCARRGVLKKRFSGKINVKKGLTGKGETDRHRGN